MTLFAAGVLGFSGGLIRAFIGLLKAKAVKMPVNWRHFMVTPVIGALVGTVAGSVIDSSYCLLIGYAGTDGLEGILKIFRKGKGFLA